MSLITDPNDPLYGISIDPEVEVPERFAPGMASALLADFRAGRTHPRFIGEDGAPEAVVIPFEEYLGFLRTSILVDEARMDREAVAAVEAAKAEGPKPSPIDDFEAELDAAILALPDGAAKLARIEAGAGAPDEELLEFSKSLGGEAALAGIYLFSKPSPPSEEA